MILIKLLQLVIYIDGPRNIFANFNFDITECLLVRLRLGIADRGGQMQLIVACFVVARGHLHHRVAVWDDVAANNYADYSDSNEIFQDALHSQLRLVHIEDLLLEITVSHLFVVLDFFIFGNLFSWEVFGHFYFY